MSKLLKQSGNNPMYPKEVRLFWEYTGPTGAPEWITDYARVTEVTPEGPVVGITETSGGNIIIEGPTGALVDIPGGTGGWVIWSGSHGFQGLTGKQKELLYEEA